MYCSVSLVSTSLSAKKPEGVHGVDTANKVCSAYIKHQRDLYAQCALQFITLAAVSKIDTT